MEKKIRIRDKERSKQKLINTVGKILKNEGYNELKINKIASISGVNKKLIYDNFGTLDGLIKAYLEQVDFWKIEEKRIETPDHKIAAAITKDFMFNLLKGDFEYFDKSKEMQKIVLWGISEKNKLVRAITEEREDLGKKVFEKSDELFKNREVDFRATIAIFVSAIYYMVLHAKTNGSAICEVDLSTEEGKARVLRSMSQLLGWTYEHGAK